ncbi:MAG: hypothetical protein ACI9KE_002784 [Polyangiales bacterium]|jgi:hypothetical protein
MSRRRFLRQSLAAAGGAALLPALLPSGPKRARAAAPGSPRVVFVLEGNCVEPVAMLSPTARSTIDSQLSAPVEARRNWYRSYEHDSLIEVGTPDVADAISLEALRGPLASRSSVIYGLSNLVGGGGHTPLHGALSCTRTVGGSPGGQSIDAALASRFQDAFGTPFDAIRVGAGSAPLNGGTCSLRRGTPAAILQKPRAAYDTFLSAVAGDMAAEDRAAILQFAREDVEHTLVGSLASDVEQAKLRSYRDSLVAVENQLGTLLEWDADPGLLPSLDLPGFASSDHFAALGAQFAVASSALRLGLTNVAVITSATAGEFGGVSYPSLARPGVPIGRHSLHHEAGGSDAHQAMIHEVSGNIVSLIAQLASDLEATDDGGDTLLDNTLIVYLGDNGETHHSSAREFPILAIGGENLGFTHGRTLFYPRSASGAHMRLSNLWLTIAEGAGFSMPSFGNEDLGRLTGGVLPALRG